ncbi:probable DNA replication complex GINS protein PSF2 isoform X3 [Vespa velutina]|uniref:probable DNA replication complex GINS protein PSF2 isoform X3 n=1 Tax=Vespa velutina TaxID=202808 RepID=UPI001FB49212|nr:probable DNA replication complex GINS protein PSF2 isoform X3 [Vespa velutina]
MNPSEVVFLAERKLVTIVPNFSFGAIHLISGTIGPFRAGLPAKVPIWLAVNLKQQQRCRIVNPEWMEAESLEEVAETEKLSKLFTKMPSSHYMDEAQLLLSVASDDIHESEKIRTAIKFIGRETKRRYIYIYIRSILLSSMPRSERTRGRSCFVPSKTTRAFELV